MRDGLELYASHGIVAITFLSRFDYSWPSPPRNLGQAVLAMERTGTLLVNDGTRSMSMMIGRSAWWTQSKQAVLKNDQHHLDKTAQLPTQE